MTRELALIALGRALRAGGYDFVTVTPETHRRVLARGPRLATSLRDVFGWSKPFARGVVPGAIVDLLEVAGALLEAGSEQRSAVRFSTLGGEIFCHSAYPTTDPAAVFFGPDTYRFCAAILRAGRTAKRVVDIGCGSGAGGIIAGRGAERVVLGDVNEAALALARVNVALAGRTGVEIVASDVLRGVEGTFDLVVANPPYLRDGLHRAYRDGGGALGEHLSVRIVEEGLDRLAPGGELLLYTGAAVVAGENVFQRAVQPVLERARATFRFEELDPDVFGEELDEPGYAAVERIAVVLLSATRSSV